MVIIKSFIPNAIRLKSGCNFISIASLIINATVVVSAIIMHSQYGVIWNPYQIIG